MEKERERWEFAETENMVGSAELARRNRAAFYIETKYGNGKNITLTDRDAKSGGDEFII